MLDTIPQPRTRMTFFGLRIDVENFTVCPVTNGMDAAANPLALAF
jgi:hypothetical protein